MYLFDICMHKMAFFRGTIVPILKWSKNNYKYGGTVLTTPYKITNCLPYFLSVYGLILLKINRSNFCSINN